MHKYRTHTCGEIREQNVSETVKLSGWIHKKRDHGNLLFIDLRDHYGLTQCVIDTSHPKFKEIEDLRIESVITITGEVVKRTDETINEKLETGKIEIKITDFEIQSKAEVLPILVASEENFPEDLRLKHRYIDLRKEKLHQNIIKRSEIIKYAREVMHDLGFTEFQTPILTASSPEGARDFLVPSRMHPETFYALPQAPQQFKQLTQIAGFDRYFQIAPCFRDEDTRADRTLEFYQLDLEMSFVEEEDVQEIVGKAAYKIYDKFKGENKLTEYPFPKISYDEAMLKYGIDKPDLRNPIIISDVTNAFKGSGFSIFASAIEKGSIVRAIPAPKTAKEPRSFFDKLNDWAREEGAKGLGYIVFDENGEAKGPIAKNLDEKRIKEIKETCSLNNGDSVFFVCDKEKTAAEFAGKVRIKLGNDLDLLEKGSYRICWIIDFPLFEIGEESGKLEPTHNPFSMPKGGLEALEKEETLKIKSHQYDLVCNGFEIGGGAIRNTYPEILKKMFDMLGYEAQEIEDKFKGLLTAFKYGVPPHGGFAFGLDRSIMLLCNEPNLREVILFPVNQKGEDLMMGAPAKAEEKQLKELHIKTIPLKK